MGSWITRKAGAATKLRIAAAIAAAAITVGAAATAGAGDAVSGDGYLVAKSVEGLTLTLEDDVVLQVNDETRIYDGDSRRMSFLAIPNPDLAMLLVEYSGEKAGAGGIIASRLVVKQEPN